MAHPLPRDTPVRHTPMTPPDVNGDIMSDHHPPTVVLVHGAWHAPWHWNPLSERLRADGRAVTTVDLPSCSSGGDLHDDAAAIRAVLDQHEDVLLVAHSYGGLPATEAAAGHPAVRGLLYLSAYMADLGESLGGFEPADEPNIHPQTDCALLDGGAVILKPDRAATLLFHDCPDPDDAVAHLRPMTLSAIGQSPESVAWKDIASGYLVTTQDRATAVSVQRRLSRRADQVYEMASGHSSYLADPDHVCTIIAQASRTLPTCRT